MMKKKGTIRSPEAREKFRRMVVEAGATYRELKEEFGVNSDYTIYYYKHKLCPGSTNHRNGQLRKYYTVYDAKTDEFICDGTAKECADKLGVSIHTIYTYVSKSLSGKYKKYDFLIEDLKDVEEETEAGSSWAEE